MPHSDEPISVIEDLDPEPPSGREGRQAWELALGLVLIVLVLGFAGWQWLRQTMQQSAYSAGIDAAQRLDWETAQSDFRLASGYSDADKQAADIASKIALRDDQYSTALAGQATGNWPACLKSIQQVTEVQPGYKDAARIEQQASRHVYSDAMSGTIALRPSANPPGLYLYGPTSWTWLPQSDGISQVRGQSADGWIAYDVPGEQVTPAPTPTPQAGVPGPSLLAGRRFVATRLANLTDLRPISFDPAQYNLQLLGSQGVWATGYNNGISYDPLPVRNRYLGTEFGGPIAYQSYGSPITATIYITPSQRYFSAVMDLDSGSNRYLLAEWVHNNYPGGMAGPNTVTDLYLANTSGSRQLLYTIDGGSFISAHFSPDGQYAMITTYYTPLLTDTETQAILLLDLDGAAAPRLLSSGVAQVDTNSFTDPQNRSWLTAAFIEDGPFAGKIVLSSYDGNQNRLQVIDPASEQAPLVDLQVQSDRKINWSLHPGNDRISLLSGQEVVPDGYGLVEVPLWFVALSTGGRSTVTRLRTLVNNYLQYAMLAGDNLSYSTYELGQNGRDIRSVFSFPISRFGVAGENAWTMFTQEESAAAGDDIFSFGDYSLGPSLLAYVSDGDLHARVYDGSVDVVLEHDVTYLYDTALHRVIDGRLR